jgi:Fe-S-cluster formation regulator IscX/YfhJ
MYYYFVLLHNIMVFFETFDDDPLELTTSRHKY